MIASGWCSRASFAVGLLDLVVGHRPVDAEHLVRMRASGSYSATITRAGEGRHRRAGSPLDDLHDRAALDPLDGLCEQRLVDVGVEQPSASISTRPSHCECSRERRLRHLDALDHLRLLVVRGSSERPLEIVEHGQELCESAARLHGQRTPAAGGERACGSCRSPPRAAAGRRDTRRAAPRPRRVPARRPRPRLPPHPRSSTGVSLVPRVVDPSMLSSSLTPSPQSRRPRSPRSRRPRRSRRH